MDPRTAALAYLGISLVQILIERGPEAYYKIVNAMQRVDPTMEDIDTLLLLAKRPEAYLTMTP